MAIFLSWHGIKPTSQEKLNALELFIEHRIAERERLDTMHILNQNHNTLLTVLFVAFIAIIFGIGGLILFTVLI